MAGKQYIVLFPLAPDQGPVIRPAPEGEEAVIVDEELLFAAPSDLTNEQRAAILIAKGALVPVEQADDPETMAEARQRRDRTEQEASAALKLIT